jgi:carbamate kinase
VRETARNIADMVAGRLDDGVTHGNGPQVGFILRRNELAAHEVHPTPLDLIVADTQGSIGFMLQQTLNNEFLTSAALPASASRSITQVRVDADDPPFQPHQADRRLHGRGAGA